MRPYRRACIAGQDGPAEQHRALDEEVQLGQVAGQVTSVTAASGCGPVALRTSTSTGPRRPAIAAASPATWSSSVTSAQKPAAAPPSAQMARPINSYLFVAGPAIDRDGETVTCQPPRDHRPQPPRAAGDQSNTPMSHSHTVMIPLTRLAGQPPDMPR